MFIHKKEGYVAGPNNTFRDMYFLLCPVSLYWDCNECRNSSRKTAAGDAGVARQKKEKKLAISTTAAFRKYSQIKSYSDSVKGESFYTPNFS